MGTGSSGLPGTVLVLTLGVPPPGKSPRPCGPGIVGHPKMVLLPMSKLTGETCLTARGLESNQGNRKISKAILTIEKTTEVALSRKKTKKQLSLEGV